jgi:hypothetical protein
MTSRNSCETDRKSRSVVLVIIANFSDEEIVLPKPTVIGVAEEISEGLVASNNDGHGFETLHKGKTAKQSVEFRNYFNEKLEHLNSKERSVLETVLQKYMHVLNEEGSNE